MRLRSILTAFLVASTYILTFAGARASVVASQVQSGQNKSMQFGGRVREYLLHLPPAYNGKTKLPLVIVLHGGVGNSRLIEDISGMSQEADKENFIVAYPNGTNRAWDNRILFWNAGDCCGTPKTKGIDDVGFMNALIDQLQNDLAIDPKRIYITGLSNGGALAYLTACKLSDKIAAIAPVGASMSGYEPEPNNPVSVIIFHGTDDTHVPYKGGTGLYARFGYPANKESVSYAVSYWVRHDGCVPDPQKNIKGNVIEESYNGGKNGTAVVLYTIDGAKHAWPGGTKRAWIGADKPTHEIDATDVMWKFFVDHPKL